MNPDATGQARLTNDPSTDSDPAWSADGTRIAFQSTRDGNDEIYLMNADGEGQTRLTTSPGNDQNDDLVTRRAEHRLPRAIGTATRRSS